MDQIFIPKQDYKILVRCFTYNQSKYIEDALNGFVMQKTNFPFVCVIMDDCSTDGEQNVIKKWMERECDMEHACSVDDNIAHIVVAPHNTNINCTFSFYYLKRNLYKEKNKKDIYLSPWRERCEYEALCEGDDYWTDPLKLKRQVEFLDANDSYSATAENGIVLNEINGTQYLFSDEDDRDWTIREMIIKRRFPTAGVVFRKKCMEGLNEECKYKFDSMLWCYLGKRGKFHYSKVVSNVYRRGPGITETTPKIEWAKQVELWYLEFKRLYCPEYISLKEINGCILRDYYNAIMDKSTSFLSNDMCCCLKKIYQYDGPSAVLGVIAKKTKLNIVSILKTNS